MFARLQQLLFLVVSLVVLSGCGLVLGSAESKINAAYPAPPEIAFAKQELLKGTADRAKRVEIERTFDQLMRNRATSCAGTYVPGIFDSDETVRQALNNPICFAQKDSEIAKWLGFLRVGLALKLPDVVAHAEQPLKRIATGGRIVGAQFASHAAVAVVAHIDGIEVVDMNSGAKLLAIDKPNASIGKPSPNGRLILLRNDNALNIVSVETGAVLLSLKNVPHYEFHWLGDDLALYTISGGQEGKVRVVDLRNGSESVVQGVEGPILFATHRVDSSGRYAIAGQQALYSVSVEQDVAGRKLRLEDSRKNGNDFWASNNSGATSDDRYLINTFRAFSLINASDFRRDDVSFAPLDVGYQMPLADPDTVLIKVIQPRSIGAMAAYFVYSISKRTLAEVENFGPDGTYAAFAPSVGKPVLLQNSELVVLDTLKTRDAKPLDSVIGEAQMKENDAKLAAFENTQKQQMGGASTGANRLAEPAPFAGLASDASVEAIGIYEPERSARNSVQGRYSGTTTVRVLPSSKPIILVLSSYEPVRWNILRLGGSNLKMVLVAGYGESAVEGQGASRVLRIGSSHAYTRQGEGYAALTADVVNTIGRPIQVFQGSYSGSNFSVGGN